MLSITMSLIARRFSALEMGCEVLEARLELFLEPMLSALKSVLSRIKGSASLMFSLFAYLRVLLQHVIE